jgi:geranyl-CoA carboxylase alpha subunit
MNTVVFEREGAQLWLSECGRTVRVDDLTRAVGTRQGEAGGDGRVRASMNGRVVAVMVAVGDRVTSGQAVLTLEAMKMEHVHAAPVAGVVSALHVSGGDQVQASRVVVEIQPDAAASGA